VKEEREKKAMDRKKIEEEWRREEREKFENSMMEELNCMKKTLETVKKEEKKLRLEVEELKKKVKEEKLVKVIVEITNRVGRMKDVNDPQANDTEMIEEIKDVTLA